MKRQTVLLTAALCLLCAIHPAVAAKLRVHWTIPDKNSDGTPLLDLAGFRIEWGSCNADGSFSAYQAGINVGPTATSAPIYPSGLKTVCVRLYAINSQKVLSLPAYASGAVSVPILSNPTH